MGMNLLLPFSFLPFMGVQYFADSCTLNFARLEVVSNTGGKSSVDDDIHENIMMDYSMGNQEAKCGSSFLRESAAKMHFSIAEAS
jgi:hypothetical protein